MLTTFHVRAKETTQVKISDGFATLMPAVFFVMKDESPAINCANKCHKEYPGSNSLRLGS